jgi:hypothetical protein
MGIGFSLNSSTSEQNYWNNISQNIQQSCTSQIQSDVNGNVIIINGSSIAGNATGVNSMVSTDASCLMVSSMNDNISDILSSIASQTNNTTTDMFGDFDWTNSINIFNAEQSVTNNITQITQANCSSSTISSVSDNFVYVANTSIGGNFVGVSTTASANSSCSLNNTMKNSVYNQAQASATQSNTTTGMFAAIAGIIAACVVVVIIFIIILFAAGALGYVGYKGFGGKTPPPVSPIDDKLSAIQKLGLSSDEVDSLSQSLVPGSSANKTLTSSKTPASTLSKTPANKTTTSTLSKTPTSVKTSTSTLSKTPTSVKTPTTVKTK